MPFLKHIKLILTLIITLSLVACLDEVGTEDTLNLNFKGTPDQAFDSAFKQIEKVTNKTQKLVLQQTDNSTAFGTLNDSFATSAEGSSSVDVNRNLSIMSALSSSILLTEASTLDTKLSEILSEYTSLLNNSVLQQNLSRQLSQALDNTDIAKPVSDDNLLVEEDVKMLLSTFFNPPTQAGDTITYTLKDRFCDLDLDCKKITDSFKMQLVILSDESGVVYFKVNNTTLLALEYASNRLALEMFLDGLKEVATLLDDPATTDTLPETFTGSFKVSIELLSDTEVKIVASIPQAINIDGNIMGEPISISIASTSKLFILVADTVADKVTLELGLGLLYAKYISNDIFSSELEITLQALTGLVVLDGNTDKLVATNVGIGNQPLTINVDNTNALSLSAKTFGFDVEGNTETIMLTSDFNLDLFALNVNGVLGAAVFDLVNNASDASLTGELSVSIPSGTELVDIESNDDLTDIVKVESGGSVSVTGTGYFLIDMTINEGECLESANDMNVFGDGSNIISCP